MSQQNEQRQQSDRSLIQIVISWVTPISSFGQMPKNKMMRNGQSSILH